MRCMITPIHRPLSSRQDPPLSGLAMTGPEDEWATFGPLVQLVLGLLGKP
jgi:hypothetical protein